MNDDDETYWGKPETDEERKLVETAQNRALWQLITLTP